MYVTGSGAIGDLLGDLVAYRSLRPCDPRLASTQPPTVPPRKIERAYGYAVGALLRRARQLTAPGESIERILVVGDNAPTDGAAFDHLCEVNGWEGYALIVDEQVQASAIAQSGEPGRAQLLLSHWSQLREWAQCSGTIGVDSRTVVLLDIDKTLLGARGRNDGVIDAARAVAMREAVSACLGSTFRAAAFEEARYTFNRREFHGLTGDNQDYVAYIGMIVASGAVSIEELCSAVERGELRSPEDLVALVEAKTGSAAERLHEAHRPIAERIALGDPTPFKEFRAREYQETIGRMRSQAEASGELDLTSELALTGEVLDVARRWQARGALLFALSDKPDEAALPPVDLEGAGYQPLHWTPARIVDSSPATSGDLLTPSHS